MATTSPKTTKGDLGKQRQEYAKSLGTFKQAKTVGTEFSASATGNITREGDFSGGISGFATGFPQGSAKAKMTGSAKRAINATMQHPPQTDISGLRGTGYKSVTKHPDSGSKRPEQASPFRSYPMTGAPQGNESPERGEHNAG